MTSSPPSSLVYPYATQPILKLPSWKRFWMPQRLLVEMLSDSPCAMELKMVSICSLCSDMVLIFSFSKNTDIPSAFSFRMVSMLSTVFLANLVTDFVMMISILPFSHSFIIRKNSSRFFTLVAVFASSAKIPTYSQSSRL